MRLPLNIAIPCPPDAPLLAFDHGSGELVLVELQGHLELNDLDTEHEAGDTAAHTSSKAGQKVGKLDLSVPSRPTLLIGHHRLIGKLVTLNTPMAILKHSLPVRPPEPTTIDQLPPPTSSPLKPAEPAIRTHTLLPEVRSSSPPAVQAEDGEPASKKQNTAGLLATPAPAVRSGAPSQTNGHLMTSPLGLSSATSHAMTTPQSLAPAPQTPLNVSELKRGSHEIVGIVKQKLVFSKRPEPVVNLGDDSENEAV